MCDITSSLSQIHAWIDELDVRGNAKRELILKNKLPSSDRKDTNPFTERIANTGTALTWTIKPHFTVRVIAGIGSVAFVLS